jgi:LPS O-antigen subunit length determinant protein (WzzB/FepE family)
MDNEIDLREIFEVLWRGKYLILGVTAVFILAAVLYIFVLAAPAYRYSASLDLNAYGLKGKEVLTLIEQDEVIAEAVKDLTADPGKLVSAARVDTLNDEPIIQIEVKYSDPAVCLKAVKQIGTNIIETVSEFRTGQMYLEQERTEKLLVHLDETVEEYLRSRDKQITALLEEDPVYKRLLEEKAANLVKLKLLNFNLAELTGQPARDTDLWLNGQDEAARPVPVNKKLYLAAAVLLGLLLSVFILFTRHYFVTQGNREDK